MISIDPVKLKNRNEIMRVKKELLVIFVTFSTIPSSILLYPY